MRTIFILLIFILGCAKKQPMPREEPSNGWAGSPDNPQAKPFEYFYMKSKGYASEKAISRKNQTLMEKSCTEAAVVKGKGNLISRLISIARVCDSLSCDYFLYKDSKVDLPNTSIVSCTGIEDHFERYFSDEIKIGSLKSTDCKPLHASDPEFVGQEWRECECAVYTHIPGGRESVWEQCVELEKKFRNRK